MTVFALSRSSLRLLIAGHKQANEEIKKQPMRHVFAKFL